jgi:CDP-diacylglycerol---glycerol-3-phosphate 3-phosphatidyltransferase
MGEDQSNRISHLPNYLTLFRLACVPIVLVCLSFEGRWPGFFAALCFGLAFITDILDGFYARRYNSVTALGKFMDPLADKLMVSLTMIMLIPLDRIPVWMVLVIIAREMTITGLRAAAVNDGIVIQASQIGKYKTVFQVVALLGLCLHYPYFGVDLHMVGMVFLWAALLVTIWSGLDYFRQFYKVFRIHRQSN